MIKAVIFDFGGVLSEGGKAGALREIFARAYGVDPNSLRSDPAGHKALKGQIDDVEFIQAMNRQHPGGSPIDKQQLAATVSQLLPSQLVYKLASTLRANGIKTAILSNTLKLTADSLRAQGLYNGFEPLMLSCEEHLAKPEPEFYVRALERLGLKPQEVLFIDDVEDFLRPARNLGIKTLLAESPDQIVQDVSAMIRQENGIDL